MTKQLAADLEPFSVYFWWCGAGSGDGGGGGGGDRDADGGGDGFDTVIVTIVTTGWKRW